jgi:prepilin-type N-terminal cleavage/methylation domain-containing protein
MIKKDKAFTLVELLVVVAVLALLASIVFSNLTGAREQAKISNALSFQSNMHNLLGADLVGWWNFDEGTGSVAKDSSGYGNDGTLSGSHYVGDSPSSNGYSLSFDGSNNVKINNFSHTTQGMTVGAWIKTLGTGEGNRYDSIVRRWYPGFLFAIMENVESNAGRIRVYLWDDHEGSLTGITAINDNRWHYVMFTWDSGGTVDIYVDGKIDQSKTDFSINKTIEMNGIVYIGSNFNGLIDDVRIYSRALTAYEVQTLYAQTKGNYLVEDI